MKHTDVVDWRVWKAAEVAANARPIHPNGTAIRAGDQIYIITRLKKSFLGDVAFITPSPVLLALDASIRAAKEAIELRSGLRVEATAQPRQPPDVPPRQLPALNRFFEQAMIAVTFSYQALEAFANEIITNELKGTTTLNRSGKSVEWNASEIERRATTEEKLGVVLPRLLKKTSPKGLAVWQELKRLKELRDATIHLKNVDQYVRGRPDDQTLYFRLLGADPLSFPRGAIAMLKYFNSDNTALIGAEAQL